MHFIFLSRCFHGSRLVCKSKWRDVGPPRLESGTCFWSEFNPILSVHILIVFAPAQFSEMNKFAYNWSSRALDNISRVLPSTANRSTAYTLQMQSWKRCLFKSVQFPVIWNYVVSSVQSPPNHWTISWLKTRQTKHYLRLIKSYEVIC